MGLAFVLIIWAIAGITVATIGGLLFAALTMLLTAGRGPRKILIVLAFLLPLASLAWSGGVFVFQAIVNGVLLDRDPGLGDGFSWPLPNGYRIYMIDVLDNASIYPKGGGTQVQFNVRRLQISGRYMLGATDWKAHEHFGTNSDAVDHYFLLDGTNGKIQQFTSPGDLSAAAMAVGIPVELEPVSAIYHRYRITLFDQLCLALSTLPQLMALGYLWRLVQRFRIHGQSAFPAGTWIHSIRTLLSWRYFDWISNRISRAP